MQTDRTEWAARAASLFDLEHILQLHRVVTAGTMHNQRDVRAVAATPVEARASTLSVAPVSTSSTSRLRPTSCPNACNASVSSSMRGASPTPASCIRIDARHPGALHDRLRPPVRRRQWTHSPRIVLLVAAALRSGGWRPICRSRTFFCAAPGAVLTRVSVRAPPTDNDATHFHPASARHHGTGLDISSTTIYSRSTSAAAMRSRSSSLGEQRASASVKQRQIDLARSPHCRSPTAYFTIARQQQNEHRRLLLGRRRRLTSRTSPSAAYLTPRTSQARSSSSAPFPNLEERLGRIACTRLEGAITNGISARTSRPSPPVGIELIRITLASPSRDADASDTNNEIADAVADASQISLPQQRAVMHGIPSGPKSELRGIRSPAWAS